MNPTRAEIILIQSFVRANCGWDRGNGEIVDVIKSITVYDDSRFPEVPRPYTVSEVFAALSVESLADVETYPAFYELTVDIKLNNSAQVLAAVETMAATNRIHAGELAAITAIVNATIPDPDTTYYRRWDEATLGRAVDTADINVARHSPGGQGC